MDFLKRKVEKMMENEMKSSFHLSQVQWLALKVKKMYNFFKNLKIDF